MTLEVVAVVVVAAVVVVLVVVVDTCDVDVLPGVACVVVEVEVVAVVEDVPLVVVATVVVDEAAEALEVVDNCDVEAFAVEVVPLVVVAAVVEDVVVEVEFVVFEVEVVCDVDVLAGVICVVLDCVLEAVLEVVAFGVVLVFIVDDEVVIVKGFCNGALFDSVAEGNVVDFDNVVVLEFVGLLVEAIWVSFVTVVVFVI